VKLRTLGSDLRVSALGLGCMPMVGTGLVHYGAANEAESIATIHRAIDLGITFFDTAEIYGPHVNEELLGRAIRGKREKLVIATKYGFRFSPTGIAIDSSPANVRRACEGSLKRLGVERIDLFYQHRVDPKIPIEETIGAVSALVCEGKLAHVGLSEASAATLRRAVAVHPIAALQSEYSIWERDVEREILPTETSRAPRISRKATTAAKIRVTQRRTSRRISESSQRSGRSAQRTERALRRSRSHGCSRKAKTSSRFSARSVA
jgi:aryl-alcohol dehydrogenase-like predicted oxidoreductase